MSAKLTTSETGLFINYIQVNFQFLYFISYSISKDVLI